MSPNIWEESSQFHDFLSRVSEECKSNPAQQIRPKLFNEEFSVVPLPAGTQSFFTNFTGLQKGITVVVSLYVPVHENDVDVSNHSITSISSLEEDNTRQPSQACDEVAPHPPPLTLYLQQVINIGQPLPLKRVFLTESVPFHVGFVSDSVQSVNVADISSLTPVPLDQARYLASLYSLSCCCLKPLPNMWILCKSEKHNLVSLGCSFVETQRLLRTYTICSKGTNSSSTNQALVTAKGTPTTVQANTHQLTGSVFSEYQISGASSAADDKMSGDIVIQFCWSDPERILCSPPETADAVVKVSATPGYIFSPVLVTYNELNSLLNLCKISSGQNNWFQQNEKTDEAIFNSENILSKTESFLEDVTSPLSKPLDVTVISPTADNTIYETRQDLDFTDHLWMFAKDVVCLVDLQNVFAVVFKSLLLGKVQPFVHRSSTSTLSLLLRQLLQCTSTEDRQSLAARFQSLLSQTKILPCLIEIGLEKMRRDYRAFFVGSDSATDVQLDQFLSTTSSQSQLDQCHTLCKLHCVLEINASVLSFLNFSTAALSSMTKVALAVFRDTQFKTFGPTPIISVPLPAHSLPLKSVVSLCSSLHPVIWSISSSKEQTVTVYKRDSLFVKEYNQENSVCFVYKAEFDCVCMQ